MEHIIIHGRGIIPGQARGRALIGEALQGNGALNYRTGEIIQVGHSLQGHCLKESILIIAGGRGSTAWSVRLHTTVLNGVGPVAMVFPRMDARTAGAAAAMRLPVVSDLDQDIFAMVTVGDEVLVDGGKGVITIFKHTDKT